MELWIRSTSGKNLTKCDCISIISGKEIYSKNDWEYKGYTICQCYGNNPQKSITPLGTYTSKERAIEVLDEIHNLDIENNPNIKANCYAYTTINIVYQMPKE